MDTGPRVVGQAGAQQGNAPQASQASTRGRGRGRGRGGNRGRGRGGQKRTSQPGPQQSGPQQASQAQPQSEGSRGGPKRNRAPRRNRPQSAAGSGVESKSVSILQRRAAQANAGVGAQAKDEKDSETKQESDKKPAVSSMTFEEKDEQRPSSRPDSRPRSRGRDDDDKNSMRAKTLIDQLESDTLDCSICSERIGRRGKIWNCPRCHHILHRSCLHTWYQAKTSAGGAWPCPGCMFSFTELPEEYKCFCKKVTNPEFQPYLTPHSCGGVCGKTRGEGCTHPCTMPCHPGFCPPCPVPGKERQCPCGQSSYRLRCGESEKEPRTCAKPCGRALACGKHTCSKTCHNGTCGPCDQTVTLHCFCGRTEAPRPCGFDKDKGGFSCDTPCNKDLNCGNHKCAQLCHSGPCTQCERVPTQPQRCACGKTSMTEAETLVARIESKAGARKKARLAASKAGDASDDTKDSVGAAAKNPWLRESCKDPIPTCDDVCDKMLDCGQHRCEMKCHDSACKPCTAMVTRDCRCGKAAVTMRCKAFTELKLRSPNQEIKCDKICQKQLSCKRHRCGKPCCIEDAFGPRPDAHICDRVCNRELECGHHRCGSFCHLGFCQPCAVVYRDGIACACGKTRMAGVIKCGTPSPACKQRCSRLRNCEHPCKYTCHPGECPPCATLTKRMCAGGHIELMNVACYAANVSCGGSCKKPLPCGQHLCNRSCHGGPCLIDVNAAAAAVAERKEREVHFDEAGGSENKGEHKDGGHSHSQQQQEEKKAVPSKPQPRGKEPAQSAGCGQRCGRKRRECEHGCRSMCHPDLADCPDVACEELITIHCQCKRLVKKVPCGLGAPKSNLVPQRVLECDDQCKIDRRNAAFRDAFGMTDDDTRIPYPAVLLDQILALDLKDFLSKLEKQLEEFVQSPEKARNLPPMSQNQRWLLHQMSSYYGVDTESFDKEPKRTVRVIKNAKLRTGLPRMLFSAALRLYKPVRKAGASGPSGNSSRTVDQSCMLNFFDLDKNPKLFPADLRNCLSQWEDKCRINCIDNEHAVAVFPDAQTANDARRDLDRRGLFKGTRDFPASSASQSSKSSDIVHRLYPCRPPSPAHNATGNSSGVGRFDRDWDRDVKSDGAPSGGGTWREKRAKRAETRSDGEWTTVGSAAGLRGSDKPRNERKRDAWDDASPEDDPDSGADELGLNSPKQPRKEGSNAGNASGTAAPTSGSGAANLWDLLEDEPEESSAPAATTKLKKSAGQSKPAAKAPPAAETKDSALETEQSSDSKTQEAPEQEKSTASAPGDSSQPSQPSQPAASTGKSSKQRRADKKAAKAAAAKDKSLDFDDSWI